MVESDFSGAKGAETEGPSCDHFEAVVEALDGTGGDQVGGAKPVEDQGAVRPKVRAIFFMGSIRERRARVHQRSRNRAAQKGEK